jgi:hypothetical protein
MLPHSIDLVVYYTTTTTSNTMLPHSIDLVVYHIRKARQVDGFLQVSRFPQSIKLTATI